MMHSQFEFAEASHLGGRKKNEDRYSHLLTDAGALFVTADGMGGHAGGDFASTLVTEAIMERASANLDDLAADPESVMGQLITEAAQQLQVAVENQGIRGDPRTTCVAVWMSDRQLVCAHVGDSRAYLIGDGQTLWQSRDHSIVQLLVEQGEISDDEAGTHPDQNRLYKSIGGSAIPRPSVESLSRLKPGQGILLCTDGFWEFIRPEEMAALLRSKNLRADLFELVTKAVERAGPKSDNVTCQVVRYRAHAGV